jgi:hypothetical protein
VTESRHDSSSRVLKEGALEALEVVAQAKAPVGGNLVVFPVGLIVRSAASVSIVGATSLHPDRVAPDAAPTRLRMSTDPPGPG